jgi:hypothetical protein
MFMQEYIFWIFWNNSEQILLKFVRAIFGHVSELVTGEDFKSPAHNIVSQYK